MREWNDSGMTNNEREREGGRGRESSRINYHE